MLARRLEPRLGDEAVRAAFLEFVGALAHRRRLPERLVGGARLAVHPPLLVHLGDDDVPAAHRHQHQDRQRDLGDDVAALPQRLEAVRVVDDLGGPGRRWPAAGGGAAGWRGRRRGRSGLVAGVAGCPCACAAIGTTAGAAASSRAAAKAARRVIFNMLSPGIVVFSRKVGVWPASTRIYSLSTGLDMSDSGIRCTVHPGPGAQTPKRVGPAVQQGQAFLQQSRGILHKSVKKSTQKSPSQPSAARPGLQKGVAGNKVVRHLRTSAGGRTRPCARRDIPMPHAMDASISFATRCCGLDNAIADSHLKRPIGIVHRRSSVSQGARRSDDTPPRSCPQRSLSTGDDADKRCSSSRATSLRTSNSMGSSRAS